MSGAGTADAQLAAIIDTLAAINETLNDQLGNLTLGTLDGASDVSAGWCSRTGGKELPPLAPSGGPPGAAPFLPAMPWIIANATTPAYLTLISNGGLWFYSIRLHVFGAGP